MSSLDRDRAFDAGQLQLLQSTGIQMMNSFLTEVDEAESIITAVYIKSVIVISTNSRLYSKNISDIIFKERER